MINKYLRSTLLCLGLIFVITITVGAQVPEGYTEALETYKKRDYNASLAKVREVFEANSGSTEIRLMAAANHFRLGNFDDSLAHLRLCIKANPARIECYALLSGVFRVSNRFEEAIRFSRDGVTKFPNNVVLRYEYAISLYKAGKYAEAKAQVGRILSLQPTSFEGVYLDGLIALRQNSYEAATFRFRQASQIGTSNKAMLSDLYNNMGYSYERQGDAAEAAKDISNATRFYSEAREHYEKALDYNDDNAKAKKNMDRVSKK